MVEGAGTIMEMVAAITSHSPKIDSAHQKDGRCFFALLHLYFANTAML